MHARLIGIVVSVSVHGALLVAVTRTPLRPPRAQHEPVTVTLTATPRPPPPAPPPPVPKPAPAAEPSPTVAPRSNLPAPTAPVAAAEEPPAEPAPQAPIDLSGVTLNNASGSWSMAGGSGAPRTGPIRSPRPGRTTPTATSVTKPPAKRPDLVPVQDLASPPVPPSLDGVLAQHYPPDARRRGISGSAVVRARIDADGRVRSCQVVSESEAGFGAACRSTVLGSSWSPPRDRTGRPVATQVRYRCRFRADG